MIDTCRICAHRGIFGIHSDGTCYCRHCKANQGFKREQPVITSRILIPIEIKPMNEKWCGTECPMALTWRFGTEFGCRLYSGPMPKDTLKRTSDGSVLRHQKCLEAYHE